ncbi:unnamed protein product, partial [Phaeothamnion confervicola]
VKVHFLLSLPFRSRQTPRCNGSEGEKRMVGTARRRCHRRGLLCVVCAAVLSQRPAEASRARLSLECERRAPRGLAPSERADLCHNATNASPAECATAAHKLPSLSNDLVVHLCRDAESPFPVACVKALGRKVGKSMPAQLQVELCHGESSIGVADCMQAFGPRPFPDAEKVRICKGGAGTAPATCFNAMPRGFPKTSAVAVCSAAASAAPGECVARAAAAL